MGLKRFRCGFAYSALIWLIVVPARPAQSQLRNLRTLREFSDSLQDLSARVSQSVVQIVATGYGLEADSQHNGASVFSMQRNTGSGVIVSDDGYIITNAHVVATARSIRVQLNARHNGQQSLFIAKLIGTDRQLDIALLKIPAAGLTSLPLADSVDVKQGEIVLAFGSPRGMDNSVTLGIVSAPSRELSDDDPRIYIQTDAPINPGNSGGPLVDMDGRVVGINTFILSESGGSEGIGFAIPSSVIRYAYASLKKDGHLHRGQLGLTPRTITAPLAKVFQVEQGKGLLVEDVVAQGPADKAGVQIGDVILSIGGAPLRSLRDLYQQLFQYRKGDTAELLLLRHGERLVALVAVSERKSDANGFSDLVSPEHNLIARLAILGLSIDKEISENLSLRSPEGVLVVAIAGTPQYFGDLPREGDVIHTANGARVTNIDTLRATLDSLKPGQPLVLQVERNGNFTFLVLESE